MTTQYSTPAEYWKAAALKTSRDLADEIAGRELLREALDEAEAEIDRLNDVINRIRPLYEANSDSLMPLPNWVE